MAAKTFLRRVGGRTLEILGIVVSTGAANAGDVAVLDDTGRFDVTTMPLGFGSDTKVLPAFEALSAGDLVNIFSNAGAGSARKADGSAEGKECNGFVLASVAAGANATVYYGRALTGLSGLTIGARYFLSSTTPGAVTATPVSGAGKVDQFIGKAVSATEIAFEPDDYIVKAA